VLHAEKPTHIQAHLVFAYTKSSAEKPKELEILPMLKINWTIFVH